MKDPKTNELPRRILFLLLALGAAESLLATFQWVELINLRHGGKTLCAINEVLNCEAVWNSAAASRIHELLGMPVAALGLVWGAAASLLCAVLLVYRGKAQAQRAPAVVPALRLVGAVGALASVGFGAVSLANKNVCPTCLGTYVLVLAFTGVAFFRLPGAPLPSRAQLPRALLWALLPALVSYAVLLVPGGMTPHASDAEKAAGEITHAADPVPQGTDPLSRFLSERSPMEAQALSDMLDAYRHGRTAPARQPRVLKGSPNAPVHIVEFTDIRCPHCRMLVDAMGELERALPPGTFSVDARQFPLDSECNPLVSGSDKTGVRCLGAKAQICLEGARDYWELRDKLFAAQESLTPERIVEIASSGSVARPRLEACLKSPETAQKLQEDVMYAGLLHPEGTPIVLLNGRQVTSPAPGFLYALMLTGGNPDAPAFSHLPPPGLGAAGGG